MSLLVMISAFVVTPDRGLVHVRKTKDTCTKWKGHYWQLKNGQDIQILGEKPQKFLVLKKLSGGVVINNFTFRSGNGEVLSKKCESLKPHSGTKTSILRAIEAGIYCIS